MKKKFMSLSTMLLLSFMCFSSTVFAGTKEDLNWKTTPVSVKNEALSEFGRGSRACHESYKALVDAMMKVKDQGGFTKAEINSVHKFYEAQVSSNAKLPSDNKGLLDLLYSNKIITKAQYDKTLAELQQ